MDEYILHIPIELAVAGSLYFNTLIQEMRDSLELTFPSAEGEDWEDYYKS